MTPLDLQHVIVRMLHDPAWVAEIYADPDAALADAPITPAARRWLVSPDPRRWRVDPHRRARSLQVCLEECPVASARVSATRGVAALDGFFSSRAFHLGVQAGESLVGSFAAWLTEDQDPRIAALAKLEGEIAAVRRRAAAAATRAAGPEIQLAPGVGLLSVPEGTLAEWEAGGAALRAVPGGVVAAILARTPLPDGTPRSGEAQRERETEWLLVEARAAAEGGGALGPASVTEQSRELVELLAGARTPVSRESLRARLVQDDLSEPDADALLDEWIADGLLC